MKKITKKAFTLVELLVVIAILAVLATVAIIGYGSFIEKANQSNDDTVVAELNRFTKAYIAGGGKVNTVQDVAEELKKDGFLLSTLKPSATKDYYAFNIRTKEFLVIKENETVLPTDAQGRADIFVLVGSEKAYDFARPDNEDHYSMYLQTSYAFENSLTIKAGLDVGEVDNINSITYDRSTASDELEAVIRTNSFESTLTINGPSDTVIHYGNADTVEIKSINTHSYYEYGQAYLIDVKHGRVILTNTEETSVASIYLTATNDAYDEIILATQVGASLPGVIQRQGVTAPTAGNEKLIATIQVVNSSGTPDTSKTEQIVLYGEETAKEAAKAYVDVSDLGTMLLEAPVDSTEPGVTNEIKESKVEDNKEITKGKGINESFDVDNSGAYLINNKNDLIKFAYMVNSGTETSGKTYKLTIDIDLENMDWTPIGYLSVVDTKNQDEKTGLIENHTLALTTSKAFRGIFDGGNHTIYNLKIDNYYSDDKVGFGFFGLVAGNTPNSQYTGSSKAKTYVYANDEIDETKFDDSYYEAVIKDLNIDTASINANRNHSAVLCGISYNACIENCDISNINMDTSSYAGGIVGAMGSSVIKDCEVVSGSIVSYLHQVGGIVGSMENWFGESTSHSMVLNCTNRANVKGLTQVGGILGYNQSGKSGIIANCNNYGNITLDSTSYVHHTAGGICGWGTSICLYYKCTNYGSVTGLSNNISSVNDTSTGVQIGGITTNQANSELVYCINNGTLSGYANYMGGIVATARTESSVTLKNCSSNAEITNSFSNGFTGKYCGKSDVTFNIQILGEVANLHTVQDYVDSINSATIDLTSLSVVDKSGVLVIPNTCTTLTVNTNVCEKISLAGGRSSLIKIYAPGVDVVLNQDDTKEIMLYEAKNVSIESGTTLNVLSIANVEKTYNSGTITEVLFFVRNESSNAPLTTYFENNGIIGPSSTNSVIRFVAPNAASGHRGCLHARIYIVNNGVITANNDNAIAIVADGVNDTIVNIHFNSGSELNSRTRMAIVSGSTNYLNISYHSSFKDTHGTEAPSVKPGPSARTISGNSTNYTITENDTSNYKFDFD